MRHLYAFDAMCDLLVVVDVGWIAQTLAEHSRRRAAAAALPLAAA